LAPRSLDATGKWSTDRGQAGGDVGVVGIPPDGAGVTRQPAADGETDGDRAAGPVDSLASLT